MTEVWNRFLARQLQLGKTEAHARKFYKYWVQTLSIHCVDRSERCSNLPRTRIKCDISDDAARVISMLFRMPTQDICRSLKCALNVSTALYIPDSFKSSGSFGLVLQGTTMGGCHSIVKVYHLSSETRCIEGPTHPIYSVSHGMFKSSLVVSAQLAMAGVPVPRVTDAHIVRLQHDRHLGIVFMTYVGSKDAHDCIKHGSAATAQQCANGMGKVLRLMHKAGFVHGDAHAPNFVVGDTGKLFVIDFDTAFAFPVNGSCASAMHRCQMYDVQRMLVSLYELGNNKADGLGKVLLRAADAGYKGLSTQRLDHEIAKEYMQSIDINDEKHFYWNTLQQYRQSLPSPS